MPKRTQTTKDISLLHDLYKAGKLNLAPEFQRNAVWPSDAKAYLIDTILNDRPIPLIFFHRTSSARDGKPAYQVIDGQQRLRAIFDFLDDRYALTRSAPKALKNKHFSDLSQDNRDRILNYDLTIEELSGYRDADMRDIFERMNKYVVKLAPQELRHAKYIGYFAKFVGGLGKWDFWADHNIISKGARRRMKQTEFAAELVILLVEGPQDKKASVDLYYQAYEQTKFTPASNVERRLSAILGLVEDAFVLAPRFRKPVDLYSLVGAVDRLSKRGKLPAKLTAKLLGEVLRDFSADVNMRKGPDVEKYILSASQQTDNIGPREARIGVLVERIKAAL
ncbi:MAG: DUF262 domain-containing protein [Archangium sp.]